MKRHRRFSMRVSVAFTLAPLVVVGALAAAACGGGSEGASGPAPSVAVTDAKLAPGGVWQQIDIGRPIAATMPFQALSFADAGNGMAVTYAADFTTFVAVTADGGATWSVNQVPRPQGAWAFNAISSPVAGKAWGVGTVGSVARTTDGGKTWRYQRRGPHGQLLSGVSFASATTGWAVGDQMHPDMDPSYKTAVVLHTSVGGTTWTEQSLGADGDIGNVSLLDVVFSDEQHGWAVGALNDDPKGDPLGGRGVVYRTTDGGATWRAHAFSADVRPLHGVAAIGDSHCWGVGPNDTLVSTVDGGETWVEGTTGEAAASWLVAVAFSDELNGWVGGEGALLQTRDGGETWTRQLSGDVEVWAIACPQGGAAIAGGLAADGAGEWSPALWRYEED